ncbi:MAG: gliding motility-associated-like protein [Flavobacteriales bacterium]|jgi:gliding motility-associated-like protein
MEFPNVFSPNQDTDNDSFYFRNYGIDDLNWSVYNRWGSLVYKTDQLTDKWDGENLKGEECSEGVYYYIVNYKKHNGSWDKKSGTVTLIR